MALIMILSKMLNSENREQGFTLVELMITLVIGSFISAGILMAFSSQNQSYVAQEQVTQMQQNLRAGLGMLIRELRMAGYDPNGILDPLDSSREPITVTSSDSITFRMDDPANPGTIKSFSYALADLDGDGDNDLIRSESGSIASILMENVDGLEFYYTLADGTGTLSPTAPQDIRTVEVTVLVRAERPDKNFTNTASYPHPGGTPWVVSDNYRRRLLSAVIKCRNMGYGN